MSELIVMALALLPAIVLLFYIWMKDPKREPTSQIIKAIIWGIVICIIAAFVEGGIESILFGGAQPADLFDTTADAFFVAALPEESLKLFALWIVLRKNPYYDEHYDAIVYAVCVGLGFAALENYMYVVDDEDWLTTGLVRAFLSVPAHYAFAVLMGYYYSRYHFVTHSTKTAFCILFVPVLAHGIFDALLMSSQVNVGVGVVCFLVLLYFCFKMHKNANAKIVAQLEMDKGHIQTPTA